MPESVGSPSSHVPCFGRFTCRPDINAMRETPLFLSLLARWVVDIPCQRVSFGSSQSSWHCSLSVISATLGIWSRSLGSTTTTRRPHTSTATDRSMSLPASLSCWAITTQAFREVRLSSVRSRPPLPGAGSLQCSGSRSATRC